MLTLPNLPTDNIYKFIAIAGVALGIASIALRVQAHLAYESKVLSRVETTGKAIQDHIRERGGIPTLSNDTKRGADPDLEEFKEILQTRDKEYLSSLKTLMNLTGELMNHMFAIGCFLAICGLGLWYVKVQSFQDGILKTQYEMEIEKLRQMRLEGGATENPKTVAEEPPAEPTRIAITSHPDEQKVKS